LQPRRLPEGGIFVPETAIRAQDHFEVNFLFCFMSLAPFVCAELPEEWWLSVLTIGILLELFAGAILYLERV
jgi:hypothetical protein